MSTEAPIILDSISKCYRIYNNPKDRFKQAITSHLHWIRGEASSTHPVYYREHWALRDITFQLAQGESIGILGRNGVGKSTLLQIVAGTLEATSGKIIKKGRITTLLEIFVDNSCIYAHMLRKVANFLSDGGKNEVVIDVALSESGSSLK